MRQTDGGLFEAGVWLVWGLSHSLLWGAIVSGFVSMLYATIGLIIESVITCLCNSICGCVDLMKC